MFLLSFAVSFVRGQYNSTVVAYSLSSVDYMQPSTLVITADDSLYSIGDQGVYHFSRTATNLTTSLSYGLTARYGEEALTLGFDDRVYGAWGVYVFMIDPSSNTSIQSENLNLEPYSVAQATDGLVYFLAPNLYSIELSIGLASLTQRWVMPSTYLSNTGPLTLLALSTGGLVLMSSSSILLYTSSNANVQYLYNLTQSQSRQFFFQSQDGYIWGTDGIGAVFRFVVGGGLETVISESLASFSLMQSFDGYVYGLQFNESVVIPLLFRLDPTAPNVSLSLTQLYTLDAALAYVPAMIQGQDGHAYVMERPNGVPALMRIPLPLANDSTLYYAFTGFGSCIGTSGFIGYRLAQVQCSYGTLISGDTIFATLPGDEDYCTADQQMLPVVCTSGVGAMQQCSDSALPSMVATSASAYPSTNVSVSCVACPEGFYCSSASGSHSVQVCPAGYYCPAASVSAILCPAGSICPQQSVQPLSCSTFGNNTVCPWTGSSSAADVHQCDVGYYPSNDYTSCSVCEHGDSHANCLTPTRVCAATCQVYDTVSYTCQDCEYWDESTQQCFMGRLNSTDCSRPWHYMYLQPTQSVYACPSNQEALTTSFDVTASQSTTPSYFCGEAVFQSAIAFGLMAIIGIVTLITTLLLLCHYTHKTLANFITLGLLLVDGATRILDLAYYVDSTFASQLIEKLYFISLLVPFVPMSLVVLVHALRPKLHRWWAAYRFPNVKVPDRLRFPDQKLNSLEKLLGWLLYHVLLAVAMMITIFITIFIVLVAVMFVCGAAIGLVVVCSPVLILAADVLPLLVVGYICIRQLSEVSIERLLTSRILSILFMAQLVFGTLPRLVLQVENARLLTSITTLSVLTFAKTGYCLLRSVYAAGYNVCVQAPALLAAVGEKQLPGHGSGQLAQVDPLERPEMIEVQPTKPLAV